MNPDYRLYHPKWHRRRIPIFWWLGKRSYIRFIARELTSVFVAYAALVLLAQTWMLGRGEEAYARFQQWLGSPPLVALHVVVLLALLYHTVTWLGLAPTALAVRARGRRIPNRAVLLGHYAAWIVVSGVVAWALLRRP